MIQSTDITFVFSGGASNFNPLLSIGGDPSSIEIGNIGNNLFNSLDDTQLQKGIVDYRCFYIFNQSEFDTYFFPKIFVINNSECFLQIGQNLVDELQIITISGSPTSGSFVIEFDIHTLTITFSTDEAVLQTNVQNAFDAIGYTGVVVTVVKHSCSYSINVSFEGIDGYKYQPLMTLITNGLSPDSTIFISRESFGSPINTIPDFIPDVLTPPQNIQFVTYTDGNPLQLTSLKPLEGVPIWVQRIIPAGAKNIIEQQFTFVIRGKGCSSL